jgi:hypothetical protein
MKLSDIKNDKVISEGRVDINVLMSLANIIKNKKVTDTFQYLILYRCLDLFKNGQFYHENFMLAPADSFNPTKGPTQSSIITSLKALLPEQAVKLATTFYNLLTNKNENSLECLVDQKTSVEDWIKFVVCKEATD